jgi:hypothetical protein
MLKHGSTRRFDTGEHAPEVSPEEEIEADYFA